MPDKTYKCSICPDGSPQFEKLHQVGQHQRAVHPDEYAAKKADRAQRRRDRDQRNDAVTDTEDATEEPTPETEVLTNCINWFEAGQLKWSAARRVLRYLEDRFCPQATVTCISGKDGAFFDVRDRDTIEADRLAAIENDSGASGATA